MVKGSSALTPVVNVDRNNSQPLHSQVYRSLRNAIATGVLRPGQRVPSSRAMSAELNVSRITILDAYEQLLAEGYFKSRTGAGTFVSSSLPEYLTQVRRPANGRPQRASGPRAVAKRALQFLAEPVTPWRNGLGAFAVHQPAFEEFPYAIWSRLVTHHSKNPGARAIHCIDPLGSLRFREAICEYLRTARAVQCEPEQVMVVSGSQQALQIAANVLLDQDDAVWMEEPGYRLARNVFIAAGCRLIPVPVDDEGLNVEAGIARGAQARAAYVTPSHQYPLGSSMSAGRRLQLLNWAQRYGGWIIEDDYDSEYRFESAPISSLQGLDNNRRVIYIGTFSKVLFASLRLGYMVIPPDLVERFIAVRYAIDIFPPYLFQEVITDFMREGHFARHIRRMRQLYSERRKALVEQLRSAFGGALEVRGAEAGMHLTVTFPSDHDDVAIATEAAEQGLWLWPLSGSYMTKNVRKGFILGYGNVAAGAIPGAVEKMKAAIFGV
ncbi:MAG: PLP-dependent aminotransferase family protein [Silvibacterium sp.]|nr:PLP-dependent aminotransferase family protein [Silvibacterium sp.]MBV8438886.1 PLP-dependent aminotransferase family protein [Silvibacterium sp.]